MLFRGRWRERESRDHGRREERRRGLPQPRGEVWHCATWRWRDAHVWECNRGAHWSGLERLVLARGRLFIEENEVVPVCHLARHKLAELLTNRASLLELSRAESLVGVGVERHLWNQAPGGLTRIDYRGKHLKHHTTISRPQTDA